jgi:hypothetical protein
MIFKTCPKCKKKWNSRREFLADIMLHLNGYQAAFDKLESGLFLFTHLCDECKSTMSIRVSNFDDLYSGVRYSENKALTDDCPRYCIDEHNLERCVTKCECAFVREIIQHVKDHPKNSDD